MYSDKSSLTYGRRYPEHWEKISKESSWQELTREGLITSQFVSPLPEVRNHQDNRYFILLSVLTHEEMHTEILHLLGLLLKIFLFSSPILLLISFILSRALVQRDRYRRELKRSALYDFLTALPNRALFRDRSVTQLDHSNRYKRTMALIFVDLDGFKSVNDTLGHDTGDLLLKEVASRLKSCVRKSDSVARIGGDEFTILLAEIGDQKDCIRIAEKILRSLSEKFILNGKSAKIGASLGIAIHDPQCTETVDELLKRADEAMYQVKKSGKNNYKISEQPSC